MRRRAFIALFGGAVVAWPLGVPAQRPNSVRIGFVPGGLPSNSFDQSLVEALRQALRGVGMVEGRDFILDIAWVSTEPEYAQAIAALLQRGSKLLVTAGSSASAAAKRQTSTVPIVFTSVGNPIGLGLVESLSHPGGNATGISDVLSDLSGKYVEFARELGGPQAAVHYLWHTGWADAKQRMLATEQAAKASSVDLRSYAINDIDEVSSIFGKIKKAGAVTVIVQPGPFAYRHRKQIIDSAANHAIGTICFSANRAK